MINLRDQNNKDWYSDKVRTTDEPGVKHIDFRMTASRRLDLARASALLALRKTAPKPILIHGLSGADRTGVAAALYSFWIARRDESWERLEVAS
ncbi:hypothetical protein ACQKKX_08260 [Neorhizobium sp. NPDC001467]|uniref:hypothetical protein n=1 Tax=Neorhizobium sp. NPDC001467 TaxID=3390595 RepID=UPI003CFF8C16